MSQVTIRIDAEYPNGVLCDEAGTPLPIGIERIAVEIEAGHPPRAIIELQRVELHTMADPRVALVVGSRLVEIESVRTVEGETLTRRELLGVG